LSVEPPATWCREWSEESLRLMRVSLLPSAAYYENKVLNIFHGFSPLFLPGFLLCRVLSSDWEL
jgi:hypothetical protein